MFFEVNRQNPNDEARIRREVIARVRSRVGQSTRPFFLLVRTINQFDRSEDPTPRVFALAFTEENLDAVLKLSYHPESAWEVLKTSDVGSDVAVKVIRSHSDNPNDGEYPDLWEVTHFALYDSRSSEMPRASTIQGYFHNMLDLFPLLQDRTRFTGHFFRYKVDYELKGDTEQRLRNQFCSIPNLKERFQIEVDPSKLNCLNDERKPCEDAIFSVPCMIYALRRQNMDPKAIDEIMKNVHGNGNFKIGMITPVLEKYNIKCCIKRVQNTENRFKINSNERGSKKKDAKVIELIFWEEHWMSGENVLWCNSRGHTEIVSFLRVLEECKRWKVLVPINAYELAQNYGCYSYDQMLDFDVQAYLEAGKNADVIKKAYTEPEYTEKTAPPPIIGFADFEATTDEQYHVPFSVALNWLDCKDTEMNYFEGGNCVEMFAKAIQDKCLSQTIRPKKGVEARIYFYNLRYDWTLFRKILHNMKTVENGNKLYSLTAEIGTGIRRVRVEFWDFLPITMCKLKDAGKAYLSPEQQAWIKKEYIPYSFYTRESVKKGSKVDLYDFIDCWKKENKVKEVSSEIVESIKQAAITANAYNEVSNMLDYMKYNRYYNEQDVRILRNVAVNLSKLFAGGPIEGIDEKTNPIALDMWSYRTASSIGYDFFWRHCIVEKTTSGWKPRYKIALPKMQLRNIIQKSIRGGRVMTRDNKKIRYDSAEHGGVLICDYDGVSLYPSAMSKLWITEGEPGIIRGKFTTRDFKETCSSPEDGDIRQYNDMIVHITKLNTAKTRHFPLLCVKNKKTGLNEYKNFDNEDVDLWVNAIDLWNLIDFQQATFEYDAAVVWEGQRHYDVRNMIKNLFEFRLANKKHPIQAVAKLMMNSIYGKSTMKARKTERQYIEKMGWRKDKNGWMPVDKWQEWFSANAYRIQSMDEDCNGTVRVDTYYRDCDSCFNIFGSNVLAMARRIIGRVMALAEDVEEQYPEMAPGLFYTDTDSMHIRSDLLDLTEKAYLVKYGEPIKGPQLGQFHVDFAPVNGKETMGAKKCIFLGKKMYADELVNIDNETGYHFRMKGIPNGALDWNKYETIWNNEFVEFNLLDYGPSFFYDHGMVGSRRVMTREIGLKQDDDKTEEYIERPSSEFDPNETITVEESTVDEMIIIRDKNDHWEAQLENGVPQKTKKRKLSNSSTEEYDLNIFT